MKKKEKRASKTQIVKKKKKLKIGERKIKQYLVKREKQKNKK